ncbi:MAG: LysM peptidoglycan-binding domain-containing protein [Candidatus Competibacteraceae bacterium]|nr:LysM peptidoglycan-binding domain-containing protein [Candidatus Competibacteraceae bacterium]
MNQAAAATATASDRGRVRLRPDHPQVYTVQPGDSLLDVAEVFLETPWRWAQLWQPDPSLDNANQIYPGDRIELYEENGQPVLRLIPATEPPIIKLSPQVRAEDFNRPIPTIPRSAISSFVLRSIVVNKADWDAAPVIVGGIDDRVNLGQGDRVYVQSPDGFDYSLYRVFRGGRELRDPATGRFLGFDGVYMGDAVLDGDETENPATFLLTRSRHEIQRGDRLFQMEEEEDVFSFTPRPALPDTEGQIVVVLGDSVNARQYGSVIVNVGFDEGVEPGQMLEVYGPAREMRDTWANTKAELPGNHAGTVMIYKVYDDVSYALVTNMIAPIRAKDRVTSPES